MPLNPRGSFSLDLSLFGSWVQDIQPTDLPPGASPDNSDCFYMAGGVFTRPALKKMLATPVSGTPTIMSVADFALPNGDSLAMFLDSKGLLYSNDAFDPTDTATLLSVSPGVQFKAETAFGKQWYAFYGEALASAFSDNPFVGVDPPLYYNGTSIFRVTSDAPGAPPSFSSLPTLPVALAAIPIPGSLSVTGGNPGTSYVYIGGVAYYTTYIYTCSTAVPANWLGQTVTVSGMNVISPVDVNVQGVVEAVSGNTFSFSVLYVASETPFLTGQSGTASLPANYLTRQSNVVTAFLGSVQPPNMVPGFWVNIQNSDSSLINGPNWTISSISRAAATGRVTVTISTQLTNLPVGALLYVASNDTSDFPPSYQTVSSVVSASGGTTIFTYESLTNTIASDTSGGSVYQTWSPNSGINGNAAEIIANGYDPTNGWFIQYFQLGPDTAITSTGGTPQAQIWAQAAGGVRSGVVIFESIDGALTAPSVPMQFVFNGGGFLIFAGNIPLGPPGTAKRTIAFTAAEGSNFFYLTAQNILRSGSGGPLVTIGTQISDNVTTSAVLDFSDAALTAGTQIDKAGNDLFNQVVLAPCLGVIEYQGRMAWWGEVNNVKNFVNMGFDGGFLPPSGTLTVEGAGSGNLVAWDSGSKFDPAWSGSTILIGGIPCEINTVLSPTRLSLSFSIPSPGTYSFSVVNGTGAKPLGWSTSNGDDAGYLVGWPEVVNVPGFAYRMPAGSNSKIEQAAGQDAYGAPIILPNTKYTLRLKASRGTGAAAGYLFVGVWSPSQSIFSYEFNLIPVANMSAGALEWITASLAFPPGTTVPSDSVLQAYLISSTVDVTIDEVEIVYADRPVSFDQMRVSYYQNPFGFDAVSGVLSVDPSENIAAACRQRGYLYILSDESLFQSVNNGSTEPSGWAVNQYVGVCGCSGPNAVDFGEDFAIWAGRYGGRTFTGDPSAKKITQEWAATWESINWAAATSMWVKNDPVDRILLFGIPINSASTPNFIGQMSYRLSDSAYNVPDPVHVSSYTGKLIVTDLGRRWSPWQMKMNCAEMCARPLPSGGIGKTLVLGGGNGLAPGSGTGFGNLYTLDTANYPPTNPAASSWNCVDDDYGGINSFYTTYFFYSHDVEQQPNVGSHRKLFNYLAIHATGVGSLQITPYIDALTNPQKPFPLTPLSLTDPGFDLEFHPITKGNRVAYKIAPYVGAPGVARAMAITHLIVSGRKDLVFPVRGAVFGG